MMQTSPNPSSEKAAGCATGGSSAAAGAACSPSHGGCLQQRACRDHSDKAEVSGSSPLRPTHLTRGFGVCTTASRCIGSQTGSLGTFRLSREKLVHHSRSGLNHGLQLVAVDELSHGNRYACGRTTHRERPTELLQLSPLIGRHRGPIVEHRPAIAEERAPDVPILRAIPEEKADIPDPRWCRVARQAIPAGVGVQTRAGGRTV